MPENKAANTNVWRYDMKQKNMDKETRIRKAQERTDELFPGKDLNDMYEMYLEFFAEYERLWDEGKNVSMEMLEFLNRNKDLIEIIDYFPQEDEPLWEESRRVLELLFTSDELDECGVAFGELLYQMGDDSNLYSW